MCSPSPTPARKMDIFGFVRRPRRFSLSFYVIFLLPKHVTVLWITLTLLHIWFQKENWFKPLIHIRFIGWDKRCLDYGDLTYVQYTKLTMYSCRACRDWVRTRNLHSVEQIEMVFPSSHVIKGCFHSDYCQKLQASPFTGDGCTW
jgi:hypothetical protein